MRRFAGLPLLALSLSSFSLFAQAPPQAPAQQPPPTATIRATARIVLVDVVVHDKANNPVHGLSASDFTVSESGQPQRIRSLEEHNAAAVKPLPPAPPMPAGDFTNYTTAAPGATLNVLLLDSLNTPLTDQIYVRQAIQEYIKKTPPGTQVAVFGLTTRLLYLQGFTSDTAVLSAIASNKLLPRDSPLLAGTPSDTQDIFTNPLNQSDTTPAVSQTLSVEANAMANFATYRQSLQTQIRVRYTLDAMNALGRYLSTFPGRKNLIWFSGSFPINILPEVDTAKNGDAFIGEADMESEFRDTTDLLSRAQVAVYPIDARGLVGAGMDASGTAAPNQRRLFENIADTQSTMRSMAAQTGGKAYVNTNGLSQAMTDAITDGADYYTLAYTPSENKQDGSYRSIHVILERPGTSLEYRRGYFTDDANHTRPTDLRTAAASADPALRGAMQHGGPPVSQLTFRIAAAPVSKPAHEKNELDNVTGPLTKGPFTTYSIRYAIDAGNVGFTRTADKRFQSNIRFLVFVYDRDGRLLEGVTRTPQSALDATQVHTVLQRGLQFPLEIDVPTKGDYFLRIAVEDRTRHQYGSLELPIAAIRSLPPVSPLPAPTLQQRDETETIPSSTP